MATSTSTLSSEQTTTISQNGTVRSETQSSGEVVQLLKANTTLVIWLIFLAIGGGLLALYYARIGYLPEIDWRATLVYLFVASIIGGVVGLLLSLSLFIPGCIWSEFIVFDSSLAKLFTYELSEELSANKRAGKEVCLRSIIYYIGIPFLIVLFLSHLALLAGDLLYVGLAAVILGLTFFGMRKRFARKLEELHVKPGNQATEPIEEATPSTEKSDKCETLKRQIFKCSLWFTLSVLLNQISMYVIYRLSGRPEGNVFIVLTFMCTFFVLASNHIVAARHKQHPHQAVAASLVVAALLLFTADRFSPLSLRLMSYYGLGGDTTFTLLLTDKGSQIVKDLGLSECTPSTLCEVGILSQVGDEYFLSMKGTTFTLPKSEVRSRQSVDRRYK